MICEFIAEHRARFGVVPICRVLRAHGVKIAPRTFHARNRRPLSKRGLWDTVVTEVLAGYYNPDGAGRRKPESLYGAEKMWAHLQRQGIEVARCTVERLIKVPRVIEFVDELPRTPTGKLVKGVLREKYAELGS